MVSKIAVQLVPQFNNGRLCAGDLIEPLGEVHLVVKANLASPFTLLRVPINALHSRRIGLSKWLVMVVLLVRADAEV